MKVKTLLYTLACGAAVTISHPVYAQTHHRGSSDALFAKKAAAGGLTEVELGKLAQQNGDSQDVKDFGAKMVTDHSTINDNLKTIATKDKLTIPDKPTDDQTDMIKTLGKKTGKAFDTAYIRAMVKAHVGDKALFTAEVADAKNPDLKQFASDSLQVITDHLGMIEGIADTHGIATGHHAPKSTTPMAGMTPPASASGDAAMSKSGPGPGGNANTGVPAPATDSGAGAPAAPSTSDAAQSKSGAGPGGNANPAPQPQ
jgi:putative membrane protein